MNLNWKRLVFDVFIVWALAFIFSFVSAAWAINYFDTNLNIGELTTENGLNYILGLLVTFVGSASGLVIGFAISAYRIETARGKHLFTVAFFLWLIEILTSLSSFKVEYVAGFFVSHFYRLILIVIMMLIGWGVGIVVRKLFKKS